jgi:hypothetical protein
MTSEQCFERYTITVPTLKTCNVLQITAYPEKNPATNILPRFALGLKLLQ